MHCHRWLGQPTKHERDKLPGRQWFSVSYRRESPYTDDEGMRPGDRFSKDDHTMAGRARSESGDLRAGEGHDI